VICCGKEGSIQILEAAVVPVATVSRALPEHTARTISNKTNQNQRRETIDALSLTTTIGNRLSLLPFVILGAGTCALQESKYSGV
jgi:hypothetical protein